MVHEIVLRFGPNDQLVGVLTEPATDANSTKNSSKANSPIAVFLNAGVVHRVGPHRMNVQIARALADAGYRSLRIDLSGLGDSPIRTDATGAAQRALIDIQDAFDKLRDLTGVDRFAVIGLCSGSFHAHQISLIDQRVCGAVFIDGFAFATRKHRRRKIYKILSFRFVRNLIKRRMLKLTPLEFLASSGEGLEQAQFFEGHSDRHTIAKEIEQMVRNGQRLHFVYTGGHPDISAAAQFTEMFELSCDSSLISVEYFGNAEHTFPLVQSRKELIESIVNWYRRFPAMPVTRDRCETVNDSSDTGADEKESSEKIASAVGAPITSPCPSPSTSPWALPPSPLAIPTHGV